jgi:Tol biopolymer transport system component/DNA-binding winged helix-turn-helix (wHTH) protein
MGAAKAHLSQYYEFGPFRLTPGEHRLYRNDEIVLIPPKEFDLLLLLVSNSGQVMDRERLIKALWPTTVVEEANLNVHISALRKALAEHSGEQQYIETLPRLGYRFIVPVREVNEPEKPAPTPGPPESLPEPEKAAGQNGVPKDASKDVEKADWVARHRLAAVAIPLWTLVVILIGILTILLFKSILFSPREEAGNVAMNVVPLTTYPGRELQPAFSPDGNQVAFVWSGEKEGNTDIYVRLVDGGKWVRLTEHPGDDFNPTWSPDGRTIAFYRSAAEGDGIFLVPALGGAARKLTSTWANRFGFGAHTWLHWSPDGKWLVIGDKASAEEPFSLYLLSPTNGDKLRVTSPPASIIGDSSPSFSPDSKQLAFVRVMSAVVGEVYLVPVDGGDPKRLTFDGAGVSNLAWTPDGQEIVFSSRHGGRSRLLRVPITGGTPQWLAATGSDAQYPAFSHQGSRLAWMQNTDQTDIFKVALKGNTEALDRPSPLIVSTANEVSPRYSPDGKKIVFVSTQSGSDEIWICDSDGQNPTRLTSFRGPLAGSPSWSPDGKQIVFDCRPDGNADLFVISSEGGQPRRLTFDPAEDIVPSWSHDGKSIYFTSNRSGRLQVWKMAADRGDAVQMTKQGGFEPVESADGEWIYFTQDRGSSAIWRMPVKGGAETAFYDFHQKNYSRMWAVVGDGIYFAVAESPTRSTIRFFNSSTESVKTVAEIDGNLPSSVSGFVVSPNGEWLLFPLVSQRGSDLMMVENFH